MNSGSAADGNVAAGKQIKIKPEMRAPPRRRQKITSDDGCSEQDQPVFLRKAFKMISTCPSEIAGWSDKGDSIVIKDIKQFATTIIPTAYKHNNFSSFVRQLNFYGFRKIKSESIDRAEWWEFRHPQFKRDQQHLLSEIKRSVHFETNNNQEVSSLKSEVTGLNDRIAELHKQIDELSGVVEGMKMKEEGKERSAEVASTASHASEQNSYQQSLEKEPNKKRKVADDMPAPIAIARQTSLGSTCSMLPSGKELNLDSENFFMQPVDNMVSADSSLAPVPSLQRMMSHTSEGTDTAWLDDFNILDDIADIDSTSTPRSSSVTSTVSNIPQANAVPNHGGVGAVQDISSILESLSPELKVRFVDKLAEVMGKQLTNNMAQQQQLLQAQQQQTIMAVEAYPADMMEQKVSMDCDEMPAGVAISSVANQSHSIRSAPTKQEEQGVMAPAVNAGNAPASAAAAAGYRLPSGEQAPEIALPLASAALGAFVLSSLQSLVNNQQQGPAQTAPHIKEEVM